MLCVLAACAKEEAPAISRQERRQFHVVMESKLRQLDRGIAQLREVAPPADSVYATDVAALKHDQDSLRERLTTMASATDDDWLAQRDSVESHYHGVRDQYGALAHRGAPSAAAGSSESAATQPR